jgi:hypothetical protein
VKRSCHRGQNNDKDNGNDNQDDTAANQWADHKDQATKGGKGAENTHSKVCTLVINNDRHDIHPNSSPLTTSTEKQSRTHDDNDMVMSCH